MIEETKIQIIRLEEARIILNDVEIEAYIAAPDILEQTINIIPSGYKKCGGCKQIKKLYLFNRSSSSSINCTGNCKICQKKSAYKSYTKHKDKIDYKVHYAEKKLIKQAASRKYYQANKEIMAKKQAAYRNTEAGRKTMHNSHAKRRNTIRTNKGIPYTKEQIIKRDSLGNEFPICYLCNELITTSKDTQLDHIIPVALQGIDCFTNVACVHTACNLKKTKDAREISTEQVEIIRIRSELYIDNNPEEFISFFTTKE